MNWDALGAVGEIIGALAVVVSLLYLSYQIRQGTKTAEDAAFRDIFASTSARLSWVNEPNNRKILMTGLMDYNALGSEDRFAFDGMFPVLITFVESSMISNAAALVEHETMQNWAAYLQSRYFAYPGAVHLVEGYSSNLHT